MKANFWNTLARRFGIEFQIKWEWNLTNHTWREWLISGEAKYSTTRGGSPYDLFWPRAWLCILGLQIGAGIYYTRWNDKAKAEYAKWNKA